MLNYLFIVRTGSGDDGLIGGDDERTLGGSGTIEHGLHHLLEGIHQRALGAILGGCETCWFRKFSPPFKLTDIDLCTTITNVSVLFSVLTRLVCLCNIPPSCKQVR